MEVYPNNENVLYWLLHQCILIQPIIQLLQLEPSTWWTDSDTNLNDSQAQVILDIGSVQKQVRGWAGPEAHEGEVQIEAQEGPTVKNKVSAAALTKEPPEKGKEIEEKASRESRKRVRPRWLREFVMAERR
ncbi:hypothetical protein L484_022734 [Morus notabilis]|uniref:Uncharacterized protein n=1 Tax=Morus notabilis TaxID=981085 RepID=W9T0F7_9ROSA|nr:hypothetical protein L484_022734 [Morus notabilis]